MDELWRALRAPGLVDRLDGLTRLSRTQGTGLAYISHSLDDLEALALEHDRAKARGIAERCCDEAARWPVAEQLAASPRSRACPTPRSPRSRPGRSATAGRPVPPPAGARDTGRAGRGRFLLKVGSRPGLPVFLRPTETEKALGNTDARFMTEDQ